MDETTFLTAISAEPHDQTVRLAYADWLEERGDPRSEYIRLEERARAEPPWSDAAWHNRARRHELRATCVPAWLETLGYQCYRPLFSQLPEGEHRWRLMHRFIETWYGESLTPDPEGDARIEAAERRLGVELPGALREFYQQAGHRLDLWGEGARMLPLEQLRRMRPASMAQFLEFRVPIGNAGSWYVALGAASDPSVHWSRVDKRAASTRCCKSFSEFVLVTLLDNAIATARLRLSAAYRLNDNVWHGHSEMLKPCELGCTFAHWGKMSIVEGSDMLLSYLHTADLVNVGARTPTSREFLPLYLREGFPRE